MSITLYDIPSTWPGKVWSANVLKARYLLNLKGISHKTEWIEFPDIEAFSKKNGIPPTQKRFDGTDEYTLPAIHDPSTGKWIADSFEIARYLDATYPDKPSPFPYNTIALQSLVQGTLISNCGAFRPFVPATVVKGLNEPSAIYYRRTRTAQLGGADLEAIYPKDGDAVKAWGEFKDGLGAIESLYKLTDDKGPFLLGDTVSWGDFVIASFATWWKIIWGPESQEWKDISSWYDGRIANILEATTPWADIKL